MSDTFKVRRDSSTNNVPTVGYNEGVDAQDVILFGVHQVTETLTVDGTGKITLSHFPVSITGATSTDASGVRRGRDFNEEIIIMSSGGGTRYYPGSISPTDKTMKVYTNAKRDAVVSGGNVSVTYYKKVPLKINTNGELVVEKATGAQDVKIIGTGVTLPVNIKSSDLQLTNKEKRSIMYKKEGAIAAGAGSTVIDLIDGDSTKDKYITKVICYYNGTGNAETDGNVTFWLDSISTGGQVSDGTMDVLMSPRVKGMTQIDFGEMGLLVPAGDKLRFKTSSVWTANTIHFTAFGWQYI